MNTKNWRMIAVVGVLVILGGTLISRAMMDSMVFYYPVRDIVKEGDTQKFTNVRLSGLVKPGTIQRNPAEESIRFVAIDREHKDIEIEVVHYGLEVPDMFKDRAEVVAEGSLTAQGHFESTFLMAKCPSKYEAEYEATGEYPHEAETGEGAASGEGYAADGASY